MITSQNPYMKVRLELQDAVRNFANTVYWFLKQPWRRSMIRPRIFAFAPRITYPAIRRDGTVCYDLIRIRGGRKPVPFGRLYEQKQLIWHIEDQCRADPRLMLRAVRRIQAATRWLEARYEGIRRHITHVETAQQKAVAELTAYRVARILTGAASRTPKEELVEIVRSALYNLAAQGAALSPRPGIRPRRFELVPGIIYPWIDDDGTPDYQCIAIRSPGSTHERRDSCASSWLPYWICMGPSCHPRRVLRALRRIEAAAAWLRRVSSASAPRTA